MHSTNTVPTGVQTHTSATKHDFGCSCTGAKTIELKELVRLSTALQITGISRPQLYRLMALGLFPQKIKIGRSTAWVRKEINDWVQQRIAERDTSLAV